MVNPKKNPPKNGFLFFRIFIPFLHQRIYDTSLGSRDIDIRIFCDMHRGGGIANSGSFIKTFEQNPCLWKGKIDVNLIFEVLWSHCVRERSNLLGVTISAMYAIFRSGIRKTVFPAKKEIWCRRAENLSLIYQVHDWVRHSAIPELPAHFQRAMIIQIQLVIYQQIHLNSIVKTDIIPWYPKKTCLHQLIKKKK